MTLTAALLVVLSASMHAGWNLFSKKRSPTIGFFLLATLGTIVWFSPVFFTTGDLMLRMPLSLWGILAAAGFFQAIYYTGLAGAYARGALAIAYPLARSLPVVIVVMLTFVAGRGDELSASALFGIAAVVAGAIILPMNNFRDLRISNYLNGSCALALVAAVGTAGYSYLDDIGMNMLKLLPGDAAGWMRALLYLVLECIFTAVWLLVFMAFSRESVRYIRAHGRTLLGPGLMTGLAIGATYGIILLAMTHAVNVSYVVGLRQLSIPVGALLGIMLLGEKGSVPRYVGIAVIFSGLVLVALG